MPFFPPRTRQEVLIMRSKVVIDDGFNPELVEDAFFDGIFEMPRLEKPRQIIIPDKVLPFSKRQQTKDYTEHLVFYEHDIKFADLLRNPETYLPIVQKFQGMVTPDFSLYRDMPLVAQMANTYRNRAIGHYFQRHGVYTVPNIRWSDERSYTAQILPEAFAFLGVPKNSIVSVGTFGCIRGAENKHHFKQGLKAMLDTLVPAVVLVYGSMPDCIFSEFRSTTQFVNYPDWLSSKMRRG